MTLFVFYLNLKKNIYISPKRYFLLRFVRNVFVLQVPVLNANGNANLKASIRNTINFTASWEVDKTKFIVKFEWTSLEGHVVQCAVCSISWY